MGSPKARSFWSIDSLSSRELAAASPALAQSPLAELVALTIARLRFGARSLHDDVEALSSGPARASAEALLTDCSELAGQRHALSRDPWRALFTPERRAFVPFFERAFTLVAWRDPVGPLIERARALSLYQRHAAELGKHALVVGASGRLAAAAEAMGFGHVWIGTEPFFELATWDTRGKRGEKVRLACNHARHVGAEACELFPRERARDREAIARVERAWKAARAARENDSFLRTAPMCDAAARRYFGVTTPTERGRELQSFVVCSPVSRTGYYLQDLVRRPDAPRGAAELVTLAAMEAFRREGVLRVTMGIVPFFDPDGAHHETPASRVMHACIDRFDRLYHFQGLQQFRSKFSPTRAEPVHLLFWPRVFTPLVAWDLARVLSA
jgi:phosphatidylglycerol lysyltransferase